jgi:hypothetical protein
MIVSPFSVISTVELMNQEGQREGPLCTWIVIPWSEDHRGRVERFSKLKRGTLEGDVLEPKLLPAHHEPGIQPVARYLLRLTDDRRHHGLATVP